MLVAAALNLLTTRTRIDAVMCVQAANTELFLHIRGIRPTDLRIKLSPVFTRVRDQQAHQTSDLAAAVDDHDRVTRLSTLAGMLDRGLITMEEFEHLKADLLA